MKPNRQTKALQQIEIAGLPAGPSPTVIQSDGVAPAQPPKVLRLLLTDIEADPNQPRKHFDQDELRGLADSIIEHGLLQPITVDAFGGDHSFFRIIAGERRWRASQLAGLTHIDAIVRADLNEQQVAVVQVIENLQRADLTLTDTVRGVGLLVDQLGVSETAQQLGKDKAWVSRTANVRKLWQPAQNLIDEGFVTSVDIAHELATLWALNANAAQTYVGYFRDPPGHRTGVPTRDEIRKRVDLERSHTEQNRVRAEVRTQQQIAQDNERGHDSTAGDGSKQPPLLTDDQAAAETAAREQDQQIGAYERRSKHRIAIKQAADEQAERLTRLLEDALGITRDRDGEDELWRTPDGIETIDQPITVRADTPWINAAEFPELDAVEYTVAIEGAQQVADVELLATLLRYGRQHNEALRSAEKHGLTITAENGGAQAPSAVPAGDLKQVRAFIKALTKSAPGEHIKASWLLELYQAWQPDSDYELLTPQKFARAVEAAGTAKKRTTGGFVYLDITPRAAA